MITLHELCRGIYATSHGLGPFHPAVSVRGKLFYWPNITHENEDAAREWAEQAVRDAMQPALDTINQWNIWSVP